MLVTKSAVSNARMKSTLAVFFVEFHWVEFHWEVTCNSVGRGVLLPDRIVTCTNANVYWPLCACFLGWSDLFACHAGTCIKHTCLNDSYTWSGPLKAFLWASYTLTLGSMQGGKNPGLIIIPKRCLGVTTAPLGAINQSSNILCNIVSMQYRHIIVCPSHVWRFTAHCFLKFRF